MALPTPSHPSDADLLLAARAGDRGALRRLTERWWPNIMRWSAIHLRDRTLAEDVAQNAVLRIIRHHQTCDPGRGFGPWLYRLVRNCAHDIRSRRGRIADKEGPMVDQAVPTRMGHAVDLSRAARQALRAFDALSERQREVVDLVDLQGYRAAEAAELMGIAPGTARATLFQARKALRTQLLDRRADVIELLRDA